MRNSLPRYVPARANPSEQNKAETLRKAVEFQMKRAAEGSPTFQCELGVSYLKGEGLPQDLDLARTWLQVAANQGNQQAAAKLRELQSMVQAVR